MFMINVFFPSVCDKNPRKIPWKDFIFSIKNGVWHGTLKTQIKSLNTIFKELWQLISTNYLKTQRLEQLLHSPEFFYFLYKNLCIKEEGILLVITYLNFYIVKKKPSKL